MAILLFRALTHTAHTNIAVYLNFSNAQSEGWEKENMGRWASFLFVCRNTPMNVWKIHLKINCLQLMWWQFNRCKMCNSASWAHHSQPVDFGEQNSRPRHTMCTSSIVHASSKALPFFMSGHACHLILFSSSVPPLLLLCSSTLSLLALHVILLQRGLADWMIELRVGRGINIRNSWETSGYSQSDCINSSLLSSPNVDIVAPFPIKMLFCFGEEQNNFADWCREKCLHIQQALSTLFHNGNRSCWRCRHFRSENWTDALKKRLDLSPV